MNSTPGPTLAPCDWAGCSHPATHAVDLSAPDIAPEHWDVCRPHDRALKTTFVRSREKKPSIPDAAGSASVVLCGQCKCQLPERSDLPPAERRPCPDCGSISRCFKVEITETLSVHEALQVRATRAKGGWFVKIKSGADYTRDLDAWGKRSLVIDRDRDAYREVIELYDGGRLESYARLRHHPA